MTDGSTEQARFDVAVQLHQQGDTSAAESIYRELITQSPDDFGSLHLLGVIHLQRGEFTTAVELIGAAIRISPGKAVFFNNYGAALLGLGRPVEALACFHLAVALRPEYADAVSNVAMAYENLGQLDKATEYFRRALEIAPKHPDALTKYRSLLNKRGDAAEALRLCEEELSRQPSAELHVRMGNLLLSSGKPLEAVSQYEKALALNPSMPAALFNMGSALHEQHRVQSARATFLKAAEVTNGHPLWRLRAAITCPAVFQSVQEIDDFCGTVASTLDAWRESPPPAQWRDLVNAGVFPNFTYSYLGRNVRGLKEKFAAFYSHYFRDLPEAQGSGLAGKRRIGIVVTQRHEGIFLRCMKGILEGLSRDLFDLVVLCSVASVKPLRDGLRIPGLRFVSFTNNLKEAADNIREARCDVLYFWEAGSDALNYSLPFCRLAPVQCTSHGSQITSGIPAIGHFYSSRLMEVESAQEHYAETLWNSTTLLMNQSRVPPPPPAQREDFGLPSTGTLYLCHQNPLKFHPDFDRLIHGILREDRSGVVVLSRGTYEFAEQQLRQRLAKTIPDIQDRVLFQPQLAFNAYCQLISLADVVLDPLHFGHGSSAYDIFSFNKPLVTLPSELNVGRVGAAFYAKMEIPELVADSEKRYIELAVRLGTDRHYRDHVTRRIAEASPKLFEDRLPIRDHERFLREVS